MKSTQVAMFLFFIFSMLHAVFLPHSTNATFFGANDTDRLALLAIKSNILDDPQGVLSSWNDSLHFCQWEGVSCSRRHTFMRGRKNKIIGGGRLRSIPTQLLDPSCPQADFTSADAHSSPAPTTSDISSPASSSVPGTSSSVTKPAAKKNWPRDEQNRFILLILNKQFVGGDVSVTRWFRKHLTTRRPRQFWPTFTEVPDDVKADWWLDFQANYTIAPEFTEAHMIAAYRELLPKRYRDYIYYLKGLWQADKPPPSNWAPEVYAAAEAHWRSDGTLKQSEIAKANRKGASGSGGAKHNMGTANFTTHYYRQRLEYGEEVTPLDTFLSTHSTVDADGTPHFIDDESARVYTEYYKSYNERHPPDSEGSSQSRPSVDGDLWAEVAGSGRRKRADRVFGFGDVGSDVLGIQSRRRPGNSIPPSTGPSSSGTTPEDVNAIVEARLAEERARFQEQQDAMKAEFQATLDRQMAEMTQRFQSQLFQSQQVQQSMTQFQPHMPFQGQFMGTPFQTPFQSASPYYPIPPSRPSATQPGQASSSQPSSSSGQPSDPGRDFMDSLFRYPSPRH